MKNRSTRVAIALAIATIPFLTGCGSSNSAAPVSGIYPSNLVPGVGAGGCVPISAVIPFTGQGAQADSANIRAGAVPGEGVFGQVMIGGAAVGGQYTRTGVDGTIAMNIMSGYGAYGTYPGVALPVGYTPTMPVGGSPNSISGPSSVQGMVQISQATQQDIMTQFGGLAYGTGITPYPGTSYPGTLTPYPGVGYPGVNGGPCVSGIAFDLGHYYYTLYGGNVYLYLNGTQHGYALYF